MNLVNMSNGKSLHVPYRDSKLTFLLQVEYCSFKKKIKITWTSNQIHVSDHIYMNLNPQL